MNQSMRAVVYTAPEQFAIQDVPVEKPMAHQVLVKVMACGICKTDVNIHMGQYLADFPLINGHEFSGVVTEVGAGVSYLKEGDRVTCDNTVLCGHCDYCRDNLPLYCENFFSRGCNAPGGFSQYVPVNADKVFKISDDLSFEEASFVEPIACAVHGMDRIAPKCSDDILLYGAGATGIVLAQMLLKGGAGRLVVAAPTQFKLDILKEYGIKETVLIHRNDAAANDKKLKELYPRGFDIVIEATGSPQVLESCFVHAKKGAKIIVYGVADDRARIEISPFRIFNEEYQIIGSNAQTHCFGRALKLLENGVVRVDKLITHRFPLERYGEGMALVMKGGGSIKVIMEPNTP